MKSKMLFTISLPKKKSFLSFAGCWATDGIKHNTTWLLGHRTKKTFDLASNTSIKSSHKWDHWEITEMKYRGGVQSSEKASSQTTTLRFPDTEELVDKSH